MTEPSPNLLACNARVKALVDELMMTYDGRHVLSSLLGQAGGVAQALVAIGSGDYVGGSILGLMQIIGTPLEGDAPQVVYLNEAPSGKPQ